MSVFERILDGTDERTRCPECAGPVIEDDGENICWECGLNLDRSDNHHHVFGVSYGKSREDVRHLMETADAPKEVKDTARALIGKYFRKRKRPLSKSPQGFVNAAIYISYRECRRLPPLELRNPRAITSAFETLKEFHAVGIRTSGLPPWPMSAELIEELCEKIGVPERVEDARKICEELGPTSHLPQTLACACVYRVLKREGAEGRLKGIAPLARVLGANPSTASKAYRGLFGENCGFGRRVPEAELYELYAKKELSMGECAKFFDVSRNTVKNRLKSYGIPKRTQARAPRAPKIPPQFFVERQGLKLDLSRRTRRQARAILDATEGRGAFSGRRPRVLSAAALYLAASKTGEKRSQKKIALATGVPESTVGHTARYILSFDAPAPFPGR